MHPELKKLSLSTRVFFAAILCALVLVPFRVAAQENDASAPDYSKIFDKIDVMIPARDGVKLHTEIYTPKNAAGPLPIIFERTPYGFNDDEAGFSKKLVRYDEMIPDGYIFVFQDIRGRYGSEGTFVMQRPVRDPKNPKAIDEGTDTYDTIDWLREKCPEQQRPRRRTWDFLRRLAHGHGAARAASRAEGRFASRPRPPTCFSATTSTTMARSG